MVRNKNVKYPEWEKFYKISSVYCIRNKNNGRFYIGSTQHTSERFRVHASSLKSNRHKNSIIQADYNLGHKFEYGCICTANDNSYMKEILTIESNLIELNRLNSKIYNLNFAKTYSMKMFSDSQIKRFYDNIKVLPSGCHIADIYTRIDQPTRPRFEWRYKGKLCRRSYSRLAFYFYYKYMIDGLYVCHKCNNGKCLNPEHLYLGTPSDNGKDVTANNLEIGNSGKIIALHKSGLSTREIAEHKSILLDYSTVGHAIRRNGYVPHKKTKENNRSNKATKVVT